jgi:Lon protease (S16) C-terminal proteolytic domain
MASECDRDGWRRAQALLREADESRRRICSTATGLGPDDLRFDDEIALRTSLIGDVMKASAPAAWSLVRSRVDELGPAPAQLRRSDVHFHLPAGAIPKDGPSAGVTQLLLLEPSRREFEEQWIERVEPAHRFALEPEAAAAAIGS